MPSTTILCEDGDRETSRLKKLGCVNITCDPIPGRPGFCRLSWKLPVTAKAKGKPKAPRG
jgi:hypothetical protein